MEGVNWGRIVSRVLAVVIVMRTVRLLASTLPNLQLTRDVWSGRSDFLMLLVIEIVGMATLATLLWFGCDRFSPDKEESSTETKDGHAFATVAVAAIGTYFFLLQGASALEGVLGYAFEQDRYKWVPLQPAFIFHLVTAALFAVLVLKSKALAARIAK